MSNVPHDYFVSYSHTSGSAFGFGSTYIRFSRKVKTLNDVKELHEFAASTTMEDYQFDKVVILSYQYIGESEHE